MFVPSPAQMSAVLNIIHCFHGNSIPLLPWQPRPIHFQKETGKCSADTTRPGRLVVQGWYKSLGPSRGPILVHKVLWHSVATTQCIDLFQCRPLVAEGERETERETERERERDRDGWMGMTPCCSIPVHGATPSAVRLTLVLICQWNCLYLHPASSDSKGPGLQVAGPCSPSRASMQAPAVFSM